MINIRKRNGLYVASIEDTSDIISVSRVIIDTGAAFTTLSAKQVFPNYSVEGAIRIKEALQKKYKPKDLFTVKCESVSCFPIVLYGIQLGGISIHKLCCYMSFEDEDIKQVLGNDFLDCCTYFHSVGKNIKINTFDEQKYCREWNERCSDLEIISEMELCCLFDEKQKSGVSESLAPTDRVSQMEAEMKRVIDGINKQL